MLNDVSEANGAGQTNYLPSGNLEASRGKMPLSLQGMITRGRGKLESRRIREERGEQEERQAILAAIEAALGDKWPMVSGFAAIDYGTRTQVATVTISVPGLPQIVGVWHLELASCQWRQVELGRSDWLRGVTRWAGPQSQDAWSVPAVGSTEGMCGDIEEALALAAEWAARQAQGAAKQSA